jgi:uncharacterized delta-60 repeat protein
MANPWGKVRCRTRTAEYSRIVKFVERIGADFFVTRLNTNGSLDTGFSLTGIVYADFDGQEDFAEALAIQPDGRIVVAGWALVGDDFDFAVARYLATGLPDNAFSSGGKVTTGFGSGYDFAYCVTLFAEPQTAASTSTGSPTTSGPHRRIRPADGRQDAAGRCRLRHPLQPGCTG